MKGVTIITIGDELLIGQTIDTNSAWLGRELNAIGFDVNEIISVKDTHDGIMSGLTRASEKSEIILMTGGLGPTLDDITKQSLVEYFDTSLSFHEETWLRIIEIFKKFDKTPIDSHKEQCYLPKSAEILANNVGTAPGMVFRKNGQVYVSMPGVPHEMKSLMNDHVFELIRSEGSPETIFHHTIMTVGEGESRLNKRFDDIIEKLPNNISIASLPDKGSVRIRITGKGNGIENTVIDISKQIEDRIEEYVYGYNDMSLPEAIGKMCITNHKTIAFAESCTGGLLSHKITSIPGSSAYFIGAIVAYSNQVKMEILGVNPDTLKNHGAVSEETVREMVIGTIEKLRSDIAISISGIAGPGGGTQEKPVGTIWIACGTASKIITKKLTLSKDRSTNNEYSTIYAMNMLRMFLMNL